MGMRTRVTAIAGLAVAVLAGSWAPIASADTPTPNNDTTGAYACSLLTTAEVGQAFGVDVQAVPHGASPPQPGSPASSNCTYAPTANTTQSVLLLRVRTASDAATAKHLAGFDVRPPLNGGVKIGDLAQFINGMVFEMLVGTQVVELDTGNAVPTGDYTSQITQLARDILPRLGTTGGSSSGSSSGSSGSTEKPCTLATSARGKPTGEKATLAELADEYNGAYHALFLDNTFGTNGTFDVTVKVDTKAGTATVKMGKVQGQLLGQGSSFGPARLKVVVNDVSKAHRISGSGSGFGRFLLTPNPSSLEITMTLTSIPGNKGVRCFETALMRDPATGGNGTYVVWYKNGKQSSGIIRWTH